MNLLENLCIYDERSPYFIEGIGEKSRDCSCDMCFYGRNKLALFSLELLETLEDCLIEVEMSRMREIDKEIREYQKELILKAREIIKRGK